MEYLSRKKKILLLLSAIGIVFSISMFSYAWFVAQVRGDSPSNNVVTSGTMEITYIDGQVVGTTTNMVPGSSVTKSFTVVNTGSVATTYDIYLNDVVNTFVDKNDLVYSLSSTGGGTSINQTVVPSVDTKIASNVALGVNATHTYTLTISFLETNNDQSDNMGASFSAKVSLIENQVNSGSGGSGQSSAVGFNFPVTFYYYPSASGEDCAIGSKLYSFETSNEYYINGYGETYTSDHFSTLEECESFIEQNYESDNHAWCSHDILSRDVNSSCYASTPELSYEMLAYRSPSLFVKRVIDSNGYITAEEMCYYDTEFSNSVVCFNPHSSTVDQDINTYFGYNPSTFTSSHNVITCYPYPGELSNAIHSCNGNHRTFSYDYNNGQFYGISLRAYSDYCYLDRAYDNPVINCHTIDESMYD